MLVTAAGVALVAAGVALADKERIARTPAGNARARAEVLRRADLGKGWSGGFKKPDFSSGFRCSYKPKQSDLVVVGAAETIWDRPTTYEIDSEAQVLRTAAMVRRDWRRTVIAPQVLPCLRKTFRQFIGSSGRLLSAPWSSTTLRSTEPFLPGRSPSNLTSAAGSTFRRKRRPGLALREEQRLNSWVWSISPKRS